MEPSRMSVTMLARMSQLRADKEESRERRRKELKKERKIQQMRNLLASSRLVPGFTGATASYTTSVEISVRPKQHVGTIGETVRLVVKVIKLIKLSSVVDVAAGKAVKHAIKRPGFAATAATASAASQQTGGRASQWARKGYAVEMATEQGDVLTFSDRKGAICHHGQPQIGVRYVLQATVCRHTVAVGEKLTALGEPIQLFSIQGKELADVTISRLLTQPSPPAGPVRKSRSQIGKMKKADLVAYAASLGKDAAGTMVQLRKRVLEDHEEPGDAEAGGRLVEAPETAFDQARGAPTMARPWGHGGSGTAVFLAPAPGPANMLREVRLQQQNARRQANYTALRGRGAKLSELMANIGASHSRADFAVEEERVLDAPDPGD
jgi:hypothetical protein